MAIAMALVVVLALAIAVLCCDNVYGRHLRIK